MRLTAAIVRARGCHCPFKQIDRRPAGRSIEQSAQGKGRKMASRARPTRRAGRCGGKTLASENSPAVLLWDFPADRKSLPAIGESRARTNKQSRTKREVNKILPFVRPKRENLVAANRSSIAINGIFYRWYFQIDSFEVDES